MIKLEDLKYDDVIYVSNRKYVTKCEVDKTIYKFVDGIFDGAFNGDTVDLALLHKVYPIFDNIHSSYIYIINRRDERYLFKDKENAIKYTRQIAKEWSNSELSEPLEDYGLAIGCDGARCEDGCEHYYDCWE